MRLTGLRRAAGATGALIAGALVWWSAPGDEAPPRGAAVTLTAAPPGKVAPPAPRATSHAALAATLRASEAPPSPEILRDSPQTQAAYDASAQPGDYVTPPSVSVEH